MKTKNRKLNRLIGMVLCCMMLFSLVPAQVFADEGVAPLADDAAACYKISSAEELQEGMQYVILYKEPTIGTRYALSTGTDNTTQITQDDADTLMVDRAGDYVLTVTKVNDNGTVRLQAGNGDYLRIEGAGMFGSGGSDVTLTQDEDTGYWLVRKATGRSLTFNGTTFDMTKGSSVAAPVDFEIWLVPPVVPPEYVKLASLEQLADFDTNTEFVIALETEDGLRAMGAKNNDGWLYEVETYENADGVECISFDETASVVFQPNEGAVNTFGTFNGVKYWGFSDDGIMLKGTGSHYYPQYINSNNTPFRSGVIDSKNNKINYTVRFEYGTGEDSDKIYIRGNGEYTYLGIDGNKYVGTLGQDGNYKPVEPEEEGIATVAEEEEESTTARVAVQIYAAVTSDAVRVKYLDAEGNQLMVAYADANGTISLTDKVEDEEYNGYTYAFVGWTRIKPDVTFLSLDDSCFIFEYDEEYLNDGTYGQGHISDELQEAYGLIGDCNPDRSDAQIDLKAEGIQAGETVQLYPLYAVRGFDDVVTANDGDMRIVGVSDWKADPAQGVDNYYDGGDSEKWLGYIYVQIFKDGAEWVEPTKMYFRYHNDSTVDLSLKFIWDELLEDSLYQDPYGELEPLYLYMSDHDQYPLYDQSGHYVFDAVYAYQEGNQEGLKYELNWMTDHGGKLDNVTGNTTVQLFISTKYNAKYYLDDEELVGWDSAAIYTTPGTEEAFSKLEADYEVGQDPALDGLMDPDFVADDDPNKTEEQQKRFLAKIPGKRDVPFAFSYLMHEYPHAIPLEGSPEALVPEERVLTSVAWALKDENLNKQSVHDYDSSYPLIGNEHGTGNTSASYAGNVAPDAFAADVPYTFHLYAYTDVPGNLTVSKTVTGEGGDKDKEFTFIVEVDGERVHGKINGVYGEDGMEFVDGVATFTLKDGESKTATDLPEGLTYTVTEVEADQDGYTTTVTTYVITGTEGEDDYTKTVVEEDPETEAKIVGEQTIEVAVENYKPADPEPTPDPEPEPTPDPEPTPEPEAPAEKAPQTGDANHLGLWMALAILSFLGMTVCFVCYKKKEIGRK